MWFYHTAIHPKGDKQCWPWSHCSFSGGHGFESHWRQDSFELKESFDCNTVKKDVKTAKSLVHQVSENCKIIIWRYYLSCSMTKPTQWCMHPAKTDQPGHLPSLISVFFVHPMAAKDLRFLQSDSQDWSGWVDAQADLRLCYAHTSFYWFYHSLTHFYVPVASACWGLFIVCTSAPIPTYVHPSVGRM